MFEGQILSVTNKIDLIYESYEETSKLNLNKVSKDMFFEAIMIVKRFKHLSSVQYFFNTNGKR